jgi:hypothetical protein
MDKTMLTRKADYDTGADTKKAGASRGVQLLVRESGGKIIAEPLPSIFSMAGCGSGKARPDELKRLLDRMREEDF